MLSLHGAGAPAKGEGMGIILDGAKVAYERRLALAKEVAALSAPREPHLHIISVGEDPASKVYIRSKIKACAECGIAASHVAMEECATEAMLRKAIMQANTDDTIDAILLQLPLPKHLDARVLLSSIVPEKDADGIHPYNMGALLYGDDGVMPCTPKGIRTLLQYYDIPMSGKHLVILGRSVIVGKTMGLLGMLPGEYGNATVTICHSKTANLASFTRSADILVAAIGSPLYVQSDMIKAGSVVIDVGINRVESGLVGDCDFHGMIEKVAAITPVPKGIGPMTVYSLLSNTVALWKKRLLSNIA